MSCAASERARVGPATAVVRRDDGHYLAVGLTVSGDVDAAIEFVDDSTAQILLQRHCPEPGRWQLTRKEGAPR